MSDELLSRARAWFDADPDPDTRAELQRLIDHDHAELARRFAGRLQFGTAGLRGQLGAGPMRMNRVVVRHAAAGLCRWLLAAEPEAARRGVVIGFDAREKSDLFAADTARVCAAAGLRAMLLPQPLPTPVLAFAVTELGAAAGVMVTASHNPPQDNGYKVYLGTGSQILSPVDGEISAEIDAAAAGSVALADPDDPLVERLAAADVLEPYLAHAASVRLTPAASDVTVAYTALHGVGGDVLLAAFARAGLPAPHVVADQQQPDGTFPTVSFPNPEEPGAMDLVLAEADRVGADVALANDPDGDRLGAAIRVAGGGWRALKGDEIGWLLADHILAHTSGPDRLVVTTLVSSSLLGRMAAAAGVHHAETFTGFKWIARAALDRPDLRLVFGYEQALGYLVGDRPLDKDGITAALLFAELAALARAEGTTVEARLDDLSRRFGRHVPVERSVRLDPAQAAAVIEALRNDPPAVLGGRAVTEITDYPEANLLRFQCGPDARVQVRPSGTEPKVKLYAEAVGFDPTPLVDDLAARLQA